MSRRRRMSPATARSKRFGQVFGVVVRSRSIGGNLAAALRSIGGGEIKEYTALVEETRRHAIDRLVTNATAMGANAVVMMRFDSGEIGQTMSEVVAYWNGRRVEPRMSGDWRVLGADRRRAARGWRASRYGSARGDPIVFIIGVLAIVTSVVERTYGGCRRPAAECGDWRPTDERFVDPESGLLVTVWFDPGRPASAATVRGDTRTRGFDSLSVDARLTLRRTNPRGTTMRLTAWTLRPCSRLPPLPRPTRARSRRSSARPGRRRPARCSSRRSKSRRSTTAAKCRRRKAACRPVPRRRHPRRRHPLHAL